MRFHPALAILLLGLAPLPARAADTAPSVEANQAFLAANAKKPGVVSLPSGLQYRVLQSGPGKRPGPGDTVQINYSGRLINGVLFDGTSPGLPASVTVNGVIRGLSEALQHMHVGDHWQLVMPPELGYGAAGAGGGRVPPNQALVFDLSLVSAIPAPPANTDQPDTLSILSVNQQHSAVLTIHP